MMCICLAPGAERHAMFANFSSICMERFCTNNPFNSDVHHTYSDYTNWGNSKWLSDSKRKSRNPCAIVTLVGQRSIYEPSRSANAIEYRSVDQGKGCLKGRASRISFRVAVGGRFAEVNHSPAADRSTRIRKHGQPIAESSGIIKIYVMHTGALNVQHLYHKIAKLEWFRTIPNTYQHIPNVFLHQWDQRWRTSEPCTNGWPPVRGNAKIVGKLRTPNSMQNWRSRSPLGYWDGQTDNKILL